MSGYLSNLLTSTTDRYNSLRRNLLTSEGDGDTEDDSHVCRVLRAYYTEKGRSLPQWLPPDPKKAAQLAAQQAQQQQQQSSMTSSYGSLWGNSTSSAPTHHPSPMLTQQSNNSRSALSDLWDPPAPAAAAQRAASPISLRGAGRQPQHQQTLAAPQANVRPLPSQRAGSYQSQMSALSARSRVDTASPPQHGGAMGGMMQAQHTGGSTGSGGGGGVTAQERLKARLWGQSGGAGGRPASPAGGSSGGYGQNRFGDASGGGRWG